MASDNRGPDPRGGGDLGQTAVRDRWRPDPCPLWSLGRAARYVSRGRATGLALPRHLATVAVVDPRGGAALDETPVRASLDGPGAGACRGPAARVPSGGAR